MKGLVNLYRYLLRPYEFFDRGREKHGTPFRAKLAGFGEFVFLADAAAIKDVFSGDAAVLYSGECNAFMADTLGPNSLLVLDDDEHWRQRRPQLPPFHGDRMKAHAAEMAAATRARMATWQEGETIRLEEECREITLQIILRTVFGTSDEELAGKVRGYMRLIDHPLGLLASFVPKLLRPLTRWRTILKVQGEIDEAIFALIRRRRGTKDEGTDVLGSLLEMTHEDGEPLSDRELRDHLFTLLLAGHDTTAVSMAWAFDHILSHPEALEKIGDNAYLDAAIKESMRLRPVVGFVVRLLKRPFRAGGVEYPPGVILAPCTILAHRDPDTYPEPERFRPERFLDKSPDPNEWFPFGGGRRRCIGLAFSLFEMRVVLATILRGATLELAPGRKSRIRRKGILLAPADRTTAVVRRCS